MNQDPKFQSPSSITMDLRANWRRKISESEIAISAENCAKIQRKFQAAFLKQKLPGIVSALVFSFKLNVIAKNSTPSPMCQIGLKENYDWNLCLSFIPPSLFFILVWIDNTNMFWEFVKTRNLVPPQLVVAVQALDQWEAWIYWTQILSTNKLLDQKSCFDT